MKVMNKGDQDKDFYRMEGGDESYEQGRPGQRCKWTSFEDESLLNVNDDIPAGGQRCDTGNFKWGTLVKVEQGLKDLCPNSNLKACPHIESKLKKLKKDYSIIYDMINKSGFSWNDVKKCVEVDSNEVWSMYVQHNPRAKGWRNKSYPMYERLANIFGKDRANGNASEVPTEMMEEQSNNGVEMDFDDDASASISRSRNMQSQVRKRKRHDEDGIILALNKMIKENREGRKMLLEGMVKGNEDHSDIANELNNMGLSALDQIEALNIILEKPHNISMFKSLNDALRKVYVENLLAGVMRGST